MLTTRNPLLAKPDGVLSPQATPMPENHPPALLFWVHLWKFCGSFVQVLWKFCGRFVEVTLKKWKFPLFYP
jgi:hypothetical protein